MLTFLLMFFKSHCLNRFVGGRILVCGGGDSGSWCGGSGGELVGDGGVRNKIFRCVFHGGDGGPGWGGGGNLS